MNNFKPGFGLQFGLPDRTTKELFDFAVWTNGKSAYELRIEAELDDLDTPYMFDVTDYKNLSHEGMKNSIDKDGIVFYEKLFV